MLKDAGAGTVFSDLVRIDQRQVHAWLITQNRAEWGL